MKAPRRIGFLGILLGFFVGSAFMTFLGKKKGKDVRKGVIDAWEKGGNPAKGKFNAYLSELKGAFEELKPAVSEFIESPRTQKMIKKGKGDIQQAKKVVKAKIQKGKKIVKAKVVDIKKKASAKIRSAVKGSE